MANQADHFRFLALPAELRNRIYDFAASVQANAQDVSLSYLPLTQVCRQVRSEFWPVCLRVPITIDWKSLPGYLRTFYPTVNGKLQNIDHIPTSVTILADSCQSTGPHTEIDIAPLVRMAHAKSTFSCLFVRGDFMDRSGFPTMSEATSNSEADSEHDPNVDEDDTIAKQRHWIKADNDMLQGCIFHDHDQWREDVKTGGLRRMMVNYVGIYLDPMVQFIISDAYAGILACDPESNILEHNEDYLERVGLDEIWTRKINAGEFGVNIEIKIE